MAFDYEIMAGDRIDYDEVVRFCPKSLQFSQGFLNMFNEFSHSSFQLGV